MSALVQTDNRTEDKMLSARRYHARSFIAWDKNERALLQMFIQIGFSEEALSKK